MARDEENLEENPAPGENIAREFVPCPPFNQDVRRALQAVVCRLERSGHFQDNRWKYRLGELLHKASVRPGLVVLMNKAPDWLEEVMYASAVCHFVSSLLLHQPSLLEGLPEDKKLGPVRIWEEKSWSILRREGSYEQSLEWIRRLKNERMLNVAVDDLQGKMLPADVEKELTTLADWTIQATWEAIVGKGHARKDLPVSVLALGKLGSREMGYLSDVDLMFVYEPQEGNGERIPAEVVRLIQRFMRMLSTPLQEGPGYVVDAQIRPSGTYGPLIVTSPRWIDYYRFAADIWEIQALLRMRAAGGDRGLGHRLENEAGTMCAKTRSKDTVWPRLCHLRRRMEEERSRETPSALDIKLGPGGLADVEFLVQGGQLIQGLGAQGQAVAGTRDLISLVAPGLGFEAFQIEALQRWYQALRSLELRMQLMTNQASSLITRDDFTQLEETGLWPPPGTDALINSWSDIQVARRGIRKVWARVCS